MKKLILFVALLLFFGWLMSCLTIKKAASTSSQDTNMALLERYDRRCY